MNKCIVITRYYRADHLISNQLSRKESVTVLFIHVIRKPPRSPSWRRRSLNSDPWKSVKRVWRKKTVSLRRPKRQKQKPRERQTEKVGLLDNLSTDFITVMHF